MAVDNNIQFQLRFKTAVKDGKIRLAHNGLELYAKNFKALPERRVLISLPELPRTPNESNESVNFSVKVSYEDA